MKTRTLLSGLLMAVTGCSSTATRFWTIEPIAIPSSASHRAIAPVQVVAVHLPLAIDRLEIVQHDRADRVIVHDFDRWSAPPGDLLRRALTQDLVAQLPPGSVIFPEAAAPAGTRTITIDVLDLRQSADGFVMQLNWSVGSPTPRMHEVRLQAPLGAGDVVAQARALARMTADLALVIAEGL